MTFARLGLWDDRPFMFIAPGESVELPADQRKALNEQTNPTWPHVHVRLAGTFDEFLDLFPCNHVLGAPGDVVESLVYLCEISGIKPVVVGRDTSPPIWERV